MQQLQRAIEDSKENNCPRCLQPLPGRVPRCPNCGVPVQSSSRILRLVIGIVGLIALIFAIAVMYRTVRDEDATSSAPPVEDVKKTPEEELFPPPPPDGGTKEPARPEKKPPLNER